MSDRSMPTSTNPLSKTQLPSFVEMLGVSQKNLIKNLWKADDLSISDKIDSIDLILKEMPKEARVEYRKWRFLVDRSRMPDFYNSQNNQIKMIIAATFEKSTDLEEFARTIMSIKPALNNPDAFDKWLKNEELEFEEPSTQKDMKKIGGDNSFDNSHKILFYLWYRNNDKQLEGRICLFNSSTYSVEAIAKFHNWSEPYEVTTTQNKIFGINSEKILFEIYDLSTRQISRGPDPPEWRQGASVAYFENKLYYLGGKDPKTWEDTNRVDVLIDGQWQTGPTFPFPISGAQTVTCDGILYVIGGYTNNKIYRLPDDEREWVEIGEIPERRRSFGVASLNGRIYITGGRNGCDTFKSCLCFDPSAPIDSRTSRIADMNYARYSHSLIAANGKLYAIGEFQDAFMRNFCNSIGEYGPQTDKWREFEKIILQIGGDNSFDNSHKVLFYFYYPPNGRICLFNSYTCSVEVITEFDNCYESYEVATTQNKVFGINNKKKSFKIYDLNTGQISRGPDPPEWDSASVAYFKDKLYYLGGNTKRVDVLIDGKWQTGPAFPLSTYLAQTITCDGILYVIDGWGSRKIYRLSNDERKWIEIGELPEQRIYFGVASLNGKIYITGGWNGNGVLTSCLCFDPSTPVGNRISRIAYMIHGRPHRSLVVVNGKLYAIGGYQEGYLENFCNSIEEYYPQTNKWSKVGEFNI